MYFSFERECPQIIRKLKKQLFFDNSRSIHDNSRSQKLPMCLGWTQMPANYPQIKETFFFDNSRQIHDNLRSQKLSMLH